MSVADLLPPPPGIDRRTDSELGSVRGRKTIELRDLIAEWMQVAYPDYAATTSWTQ
jgi:hypothetical protein